MRLAPAFLALVAASTLTGPGRAEGDGTSAWIRTPAVLSALIIVAEHESEPYWACDRLMGHAYLAVVAGAPTAGALVSIDADTPLEPGTRLVRSGAPLVCNGSYQVPMTFDRATRR